LIGKFAPGSAALSFWYRPTKFGAPKLNKDPKVVTVLHVNKDDTYTVEFDEDGNVLDDVQEKYLKDVTEEDYADLSIWKAVLNMRIAMEEGFDEKEVDSKYIRMATKISPYDRLEKLLGHKLEEKFEKCFDDCLRELGPHWTFEDVSRAFKMLGKGRKADDIEKWTKKNITFSDIKVIELWQFILIYANLNYGPQLSNTATFASNLGKTLNEKNFLANFEKLYGKKQLIELEDVFSRHAQKGHDNDNKLSARSLMEAFTALGKGMTISKLTSWMEEADVHLHDYLSLADFAAAYLHLFPVKETTRTSTENIVASLASLSDIAVQVLREEKWVGSSDQTQSLVTRLCAGRSSSVINCVGKLRNAFETLDTNNAGFLPLSYCIRLFNEAQIMSNEINSMITKFENRMQQSATNVFSLPEVFEYFGAALQQYAENMLSLNEAVSLFRLRFSTNDVHRALKLALNIVENVINHPNQNKYWYINIDGDNFTRCIWQYEEGKKLMKSLGFGEPYEITNAQKAVRRVISLRGIHSQTKQLNNEILKTLKLRCEELHTELVALEGAPSVAAAIREIRMYHSLPEVRVAVETALKIVQNVLAEPNDVKKFRIKKHNPTFQRNLGRLNGSTLLMNAIGYSAIVAKEGVIEDDPSAFVLRPKLISSTLMDGGGISI
jgi:Ca2+-binding EF-hand superfamily protein